MAASTSTRPASRSRTVRYAPRPQQSSSKGFGSPRPSNAPARPRTGGRTQQGTAKAKAAATAKAPAPAPAARAPSTRTGGRNRRSVSYQRPSRIQRASLPDTNYGGVIAAEFVGVILAIALSPVAKGSKSQGVSPYAGGDMVKLVAATLLFVILGFIATTSRSAARISAWLGGLTLIVVGLAEGTNLAKEFGLFTGGLAAAAQGQPSGGSELSQAQILQAELQTQGQVEAISQGQGVGSQIIGALNTSPFWPGGPQGVPVSKTGMGKPL